MNKFRGKKLLIDWLTLRIKLDDSNLGMHLHDRIMQYMGITVCFDIEGGEKWRKHTVDFEKLRSDSPGLFWTITADGQSQRYLTIGGSPASIEHEGLNVFGSMDIEHCATVMINQAGLALDAILPKYFNWQCRRLDITANYDLGNSAQVKQALRLLMGTDTARRKANSDRKGGDSVYWSPASDLLSGKAYHKGPQLRMKVKSGDLLLDDETLELADNLLRLELRLGARWFRRYEVDQEWHSLTEYELTEIYNNFFNTFIGEGKEVHDMGTLLKELEKVCPTPGRALAAHRTWALIKTVGYIQTKESMPGRTFRLHCSYLRDAGVSDADLCAGKILEFRKQALVLRAPVLSWTEIRRAA